MPFRLWNYLAKVGVIILLAIMVPAFFKRENPMLAAASLVATYLFIALGSLGAVMGAFAAFGKLKMLCPFCGRGGQVGGSRNGGMGMVCETCGIVRTTGFMGLNFMKEPVADEETGEDDED